MSIYRDDFTILVQGPLGSTSCNNIENYLRYAKVVFSYWDEPQASYDNAGTFSQNLEIISKFGEKIQSFSNPLPDIKLTVGCAHSSTFYYAICSMFNGLKHIDTEYVIKTRSDEFYDDLTPFIEKFLEDEEKIVCGNIFVRNSIPYHFGDHIFVCKTEILLRATTMLKNFYEAAQLEHNKPDIPPWSKEASNGAVAESILSRAILEAKGIPHYATGNEEEWKSIFRDNFYIIDINLTKKFIARYHAAGASYIDIFENPHGIQCMEDF